MKVRALTGLLSLAFAAACTTVVKGTTLPAHRFVAQAGDFKADPDVVVMHYYGAGGWGILWRKQYLLLAPYFSNYGLGTLLANSCIAPDRERIREGFANTPAAETSLILIGHGHIDHAGDIDGYFDAGVIPPYQAGLVADETVVNILDADRSQFACVAALKSDAYGKLVDRCVPKEFFRIVPLHSAHAPHVHLPVLDIGIAAFDGAVTKPLKRRPNQPKDFQLGYPLAFVIDLLDPSGKTAFRIHYMDAAAGPPHGLLPSGGLPDPRPVDVHIGCVPGYDFVAEYPEAVLKSGKVHYVMAAHWEDFFQDPHDRLTPVRGILSDKKIEAFIDRVEAALKESADDGEPHPPCPPDGAGEKCGVHPILPPRGPSGANWDLPIPGETFQFKTGR